MAEVKQIEVSIDENRESRAIYVWGLEAMKRMRTCKVLISGLTGVGAEIAKNVILGGVKSCTLHDDSPTVIADLSSQFYLTEADVGQPRAAACLDKLRELNEQVDVELLEGPLTLDSAGISQFHVVVMVNSARDQLLSIGDYCHKNGIMLIATGSYGLYGYAFSDFGEEFVCLDKNGENPRAGMVVSISSEEEGLVTVSDDEMHGLSDGDLVTFVGVEGMDELNQGNSFVVAVKSPYTFSIGDTTGFGVYTRGGYFTEVKTPVQLSFQSFRESLAEPTFTMSNMFDFERPAKLHTLLQALWSFQDAHDGALPTPGDPAHAAQVVDFAREIVGPDAAESIDSQLITNLALGSSGNLNPMAAFWGGVVGQEVLKACCGKFLPLQQWLHYDAAECLPKAPLAQSEVAPLGSRYDGQIAVFGQAFQELLASQKTFLVGSGALGCEFLKNFALMGIATCGEGQLYVTDMDSIETSNLSRQFLFRPWDVTKMKSVTAAAAACVMNQDLRCTAWEDKVAPDTESKFNDDFWSPLNVVVNALDNVEARKYVDSRCVYFGKPLLESGTLGSKSNVQPVVPHQTQSYSSTRDAPGKDFPVCTIKYFPTLIEHTLTWGRDLFEGLFNNSPAEVLQFLKKEDYITSLEKQRNSKLPRLKTLQRMLLLERVSTFEDCVRLARLRFEESLCNNIRQLLAIHPLDKQVDGKPFWSEKKKPPQPVIFDVEDSAHWQFIVSASNLYATVWGLPTCSDREVILEALASVVIAEFVPDNNTKIAANDEEEKALAKEQENVDVDAEGASIIESLPPVADLLDLSLVPAEFEKDDDTNFHMAFITAASNLRARAYKIPEADAMKSKQIVGRIIPAIATTTAMTTGAVMLEYYKLLQGHGIEAFRSSNFNLAVNTYTGFEPFPCEKRKTGGLEYTLWDNITLEEDLTTQDLLDKLEEDYGLDTLSISTAGADAVILWACFMSDEIMEPRLDMLLSDVYREVKGVSVDGKYLCLQVDADAEDDDESDSGSEEEDEEANTLPVIRIIIA